MNSYKSCSPSKWAVAVMIVCWSVYIFAAAPTLAVNPTSLAFGNVAVGASVTKNVVVLNSGDGNTTISSVVMSGAGFSITGLALPLTLGAGQSATFQVKFAPSAAGRVSGAGYLRRTNGTVLATVALSGTGVTSADTTAPTVSVTAPTSGASISGTVALSAAASDNVGVVGVQFYVGGTAIGTEDTVAPYAVNWDTKSVSNGTGYIITARARDAAGNLKTSTGVSASVNNTTSTAVPHSVDLAWNASTSSVIGYYVYRSTQAGGPYSRVTSTPGPATMFTDGSVASGQVYYYVVTAVDANMVESVNSNESMAVIPQ